MPNRVVVHAYDLSQGMARAMSMQLMGKQIDAIYHTAIVVYGREFFYGGGIASAPPGQTHFGAPLEVIELGTTEVPEALFLEWLSSNAGRFRAEDYNLLRHNCNTFTDEAAQFLVGGGLPPHIARMIPEIMSSPMGAALAPMLENLSTQQQHQLGGHQPIGAGPAAHAPPPPVNPWANIAPPPTAPPAAPPAAPAFDSDESALAAARDGVFAPLLAALRENDADTRSDLRARLAKIATNLLRAPEEDKFRRLRLANATVQKRLVAPSGARAWLEALGFAEAAGDADAPEERALTIDGAPDALKLHASIAALGAL